MHESNGTAVHGWAPTFPSHTDGAATISSLETMTPINYSLMQQCGDLGRYVSKWAFAEVSLPSCGCSSRRPLPFFFVFPQINRAAASPTAYAVTGQPVPQAVEAAVSACTAESPQFSLNVFVGDSCCTAVVVVEVDDNTSLIKSRGCQTPTSVPWNVPSPDAKRLRFTVYLDVLPSLLEYLSIFRIDTSNASLTYRKVFCKTLSVASVSEPEKQLFRFRTRVSKV